MEFEIYYQKLDYTSKRELDAGLNALAGADAFYYRVVANIRREYELIETEWAELTAFFRRPGLSKTEIVEGVRAFAKDGRTLRGRQAPLPENQVYGRVLTFDRFKSILELTRDFPNPFAIDAAIHAHLDIAIGEFDTKWLAYPMGEYSIWATFEENSDKPFGNPPPPVKELVCSLGLDPVNSIYLLFIYRLPKNVLPRIPTICDAFAGNLWNPHFLRADSKARYGKTRPADGCSPSGSRHEVIHGVIDLKQLIEPIRIG